MEKRAIREFIRENDIVIRKAFNFYKNLAIDIEIPSDFNEQTEFSIDGTILYYGIWRFFLDTQVEYTKHSLF